MATFLQLVNDLERESGTIQQGSRLGSVVSPFGRQEKIVGWIVEAWRHIQTARGDWPWMRREFQAALTIGQMRYTPAQLLIKDFSDWVASDGEGYQPYTIWDAVQGKAFERALHMQEWNSFKSRWLRGVHPNAPPVYVSSDQLNSMAFGPTPDKAYIVTGEYRRTPQILALNNDVPIMPAEHHAAIVWKALALLGDHDESPATISAAMAKYTQAFRALCDSTLPSVSM